MSLVLYSAILFYPGGGVASGASVEVQLRSSNQGPLMFSDMAGTSPLSSPLTADGTGMIQFYAAPGYYDAFLAGSVFPIDVDDSFTDPVWPDVWIHEQLSPAAVWTVDHHFGVVPAVDVVAGGVSEISAVAHPNASQTTITFGGPSTGTAYLRR